VWRPGAEVTMADGQVWHLRKPLGRFTLDDGPRGYRTVFKLPGDDHFAEKMARLDACHEFNREVGDLPEAERVDAWSARPDLHLAPAELAVAAALLLANYDLTRAEAASLLEFGYDPDEDPEGFALREAVLGVAYGHAPKPRAGGSASA
jgi:hypothetical protein